MTKRLNKTFRVLVLVAMLALSMFFLTACGEIHVEKVELNTTAQTITVGDTFQLTATVTPKDATNKKIVWSSSNNEVASVNQNGEVTGLAVGSAKITVKTEDGEKTAVCDFTVKNPYVEIVGLSQEYTTIDEAISAAESGSTLRVYGNVTVGANNVVIDNKNLTIIGGSVTGVNVIKAKGEKVADVYNFIRITNNSSVTFKDLIIDANGENSNVRALRVENSNLILQNVTVKNGMYTEGTNAFGSGVMLTGTATATIKDSTITNNKFVASEGYLEDLDNIAKKYSQDLWMGSQTLVVIENSTVGYAYKNANEYTREGGSYVIVKGQQTNIANMYLEYDSRGTVNGKTITEPSGKMIYLDGNVRLLISEGEGFYPTELSSLIKNKMYEGKNRSALDIPVGLTY